MRPERRVHLWVRLRAEWLLGQLYDLSEPKDRRRAYDPRYCIRNSEGGTFTRASKCSHTIDHRVSETRAAVAYLQPLAATPASKWAGTHEVALGLCLSLGAVVLLFFCTSHRGQHRQAAEAATRAAAEKRSGKRRLAVYLDCEQYRRR